MVCKHDWVFFEDIIRGGVLIARRWRCRICGLWRLENLQKGYSYPCC